MTSASLELVYHNSDQRRLPAMTSTSSTTSPVVRVGIDIAKLTHQILWELPGGKRRGLRVANT